MSKESWLAEFYPITAKQAVQQGGGAVPLIEHSLRKWEGLRPENLERHGVRIDSLGDVVTDDASRPGIGDIPVVRIDATTCSLCEEYFLRFRGGGGDACSACPLAQVRHGVACTDRAKSENMPPWSARPRVLFDGRKSGSPEPMIEWLRKALQAALRVDHG